MFGFLCLQGSKAESVLGEALLKRLKAFDIDTVQFQAKDHTFLHTSPLSFSGKLMARSLRIKKPGLFTIAGAWPCEKS